MEFKPSQFTMLFHDYPKIGNHILYNTLTRSMASVDDRGRAVLEGLPDIPADWNVHKWLSALAKQRFIVPKELNEGELYIQRLEDAKADTDLLQVTLSLIQACNLACGYCYQQGNSTTHDRSRITKQGVEGSIQTGEVIRFLRRQCEERNVKRLYFSAYGGEPLLNKTALIEIVSAMQTYCREQGIQWGFDMVSNGVLLDRATVLELKRYGFVKVQTTIDGTKETHDRSRSAKSGRYSSYDQIMSNLDRWAGLIFTDVLSVVSESNIDEVHDLIDILADKGYADKGVRMTFSPISPTYDDETVAETEREYTDNPKRLGEESEVIDEITRLQIHAAQRGLIDDLRPRETFCSVLRANGQSITMTPDGKIYSCALFLGRDSRYETGHISTSKRGGLDALMQTFEYPDQCKKCTYLPVCANCRADALSTTGDILGANPYKERYNRMLPQLIKAHYDLFHR